MDLHDLELKHAVSAVKQAAGFCHAIRAEKRIRPMTKADGSPVTNADLGSQALIVSALRQVFPTDPIMAEETLDADDFQDTEFNEELLQDLSRAGTSFTDMERLAHVINRTIEGQSTVAENWRDRYWVLDPIDGTKGFLKGGQYAVALGLIEHGEVQVAVLACPEFQITENSEKGWILYAVKGQGAWATPLFSTSENSSLALHVSRNLGLTQTLNMCESLNHSPHGISGQVAARLGVPEAHIFKMDSQAKYASVACGLTDFYLRLPTSKAYYEAVWDHAAGALVLTEAGGRVTDMFGLSLAWNDSRSWSENHRLSQANGVVVTNSLIHDKVINAIAEVMKSQSGTNPS
jgi:HAL2 family 3'(2'),5'-bisphosphate nucleotidase